MQMIKARFGQFIGLLSSQYTITRGESINVRLPPSRRLVATRPSSGWPITSRTKRVKKRETSCTHQNKIQECVFLSLALAMLAPLSSSSSVFPVFLLRIYAVDCMSRASRSSSGLTTAYETTSTSNSNSIIWGQLQLVVSFVLNNKLPSSYI